MGTAALFFVEANTAGHHWKFCLGMTSDGFPPSLRYCAETYTHYQKIRRLTNTQACKHENVASIFKAVETLTKGNIFHVPNYLEADWIYHSAIWSPRDKTLKLYEGCLEHQVRTQKLRAGKWTQTYLSEFADPSLYTGHAA